MNSPDTWVGEWDGWMLGSQVKGWSMAVKEARGNSFQVGCGCLLQHTNSDWFELE